MRQIDGQIYLERKRERERERENETGSDRRGKRDGGRKKEVYKVKARETKKSKME